MSIGVRMIIFKGIVFGCKIREFGWELLLDIIET
jgi:hypothetical protein